MIRYIEKGDIFRIDGVSSYAHGCNCAGAMGKGIAVQFKSKYPDMYLEYKQLCKENKFCPGDVFDYDYGNGHIYNLGTQATWRTRAKIEYIEKALIQMLELAKRDNVTAIALPAIGAGLGGLKWDDVKAILDTMKKSVLITIGCLFSIAARSQFVTYEAVPRPNISIPESNFSFNFPQPTIPNISVVNSDIVTMEALCVQTEGENFIIGTKVIVRTLSNGATTLGLIGIKQGQKWNSLDEISLISISKSLAQAKTKEEKDFLLMLSDFSYMAALGEYSLLLFK